MKLTTLVGASFSLLACVEAVPGIVGPKGANVRSSPGFHFAPKRWLRANTPVEVTCIRRDGQVFEGTTHWAVVGREEFIHSNYVRPNGPVGFPFC